MLVMILGSVNMHLIVFYGFNEKDSLSRILTFWVFTVTGLGIYILFRYRDRFNERARSTSAATQISHFNFSLEGTDYQIPVEDILYAESLENYVRLVTTKKKYLIRLSLKEAEQRLPQPGFIRISRSHIVNISRIGSHQPDSIQVGDQELKIGKIYKRFVEEKLK
jgi:DNA-binding LytR/AlgR family response regulator